MKVQSNIPGGAGPAGLSLRVHSILYGNAPERIIQTVDHLDRAADKAIAAGAFSSVQLVYGDSSPEPVLTELQLAQMRKRFSALSTIELRFFGANLGSAGGQNKLLEDLSTDCVLVMNPDVMLAPDALIELARPLKHARVGMVEARQLPVEHPKEYDKATGETGWACTALTLIPTLLMHELGGFDAKSFFLYCDDLDFSWRVRLAGHKVIYQPSAVGFHDKRLTDHGKWSPTGAEVYYSAEAALMMAHKYSRDDVVADILHTFTGSQSEPLERAAEEYRSRKRSNSLPKQIDPTHTVSEFHSGLYARHRFPL